MFFPDLPADVKRLLEQALLLMKRDRPIRRAPAVRTRIDRDMRHQMFRLNASDLTIHEIANEVGVRNSGRVSEVLNGKR
jgi:hypothetical protein